MKRCNKCGLPETHETISFDKHGVCNICLQHDFKRDKIDWAANKKVLDGLIEEHRGKYDYDCIVPFSGGKDSTYQVIRILELGLNPLCVTSITCDLSDIGRKNIQNIKQIII